MFLTTRPWLVVPACAAVVLATPVVRGQDAQTADASAVARRAGDSVEKYLASARTIEVRETVTLQPLATNLSEAGVARRLVYDTRVEWEPSRQAASPTAILRRALVSIDGRPPRGREEEGCLPPNAPEPLAFLLPSQRSGYTFALAPGGGSRDRSLALEYTPREAGRPALVWRGDCGSFELPGLMRGRVVLDPSTYAVSRLEQRLVQPVRVPVPREQRRDDWGESILLERLDVQMAYEPVQFRQPDETLILPVEIRRVSLVRTPAPRALRVTQRFSNHRRFVTDVRVVPVP